MFFEQLCPIWALSSSLMAWFDVGLRGKLSFQNIICICFFSVKNQKYSCINIHITNILKQMMMMMIRIYFCDFSTKRDYVGIFLRYNSLVESLGYIFVTFPQRGIMLEFFSDIIHWLNRLVTHFWNSCTPGLPLRVDRLVNCGWIG